MARLKEKDISAIENILNKGNYCEIKAFKYGLQITEIKKNVIMKPPTLEGEGRDKRSVK